MESSLYHIQQIPNDSNSQAIKLFSRTLQLFANWNEIKTALGLAYQNYDDKSHRDGYFKTLFEPLAFSKPDKGHHGSG